MNTTKLYPEAIVSYDQTGINRVEHVATFQDSDADEVGNLLSAHYETDNADALIDFIFECSCCLEHDNTTSFDQARGCLRGDWIRITWKHGDYILFKQLGMQLYSLYNIVA